MKRIDFENGTVTRNIFSAAIPMLVAQILSLLYNIVDRIYIARIPEVGTTALGAVGLCFPLPHTIVKEVFITSCAFWLSFIPLFIEKTGAPPLPNRLAKAVITTINGKQSRLRQAL